MSLAVVRCPACRGESRVSVDALGHMVGCPRCQTPFVAEEDIPVVHPVTRPTPQSNSPRSAAPAQRESPLVVQPRRRRLESNPEPPETLPADAVPEIPDPEHDPHLPSPAGLPVSVLVGLALLPFGIPILWRIAPFLTGREAALSLAVPIALAVSAAALCLGVVYTIDWTATTRIKGVLMLVGLAYLSAAGLFFLKKDMVDRMRAWGSDPNKWNHVSLNGGKGKVRMPGDARPDNLKPLAGLQMDEVKQAHHGQDEQDGPRYVYWVAVSKTAPPAKKPDAAWFDRIRNQLKDENGEPTTQTELRHQDKPDAPGRQWTFERDGGKINRIVRVFAIEGSVYYLAAEGPNLKPDDEFGKPFFESFFVKVN